MENEIRTAIILKVLHVFVYHVAKHRNGLLIWHMDTVYNLPFKKVIPLTAILPHNISLHPGTMAIKNVVEHGLPEPRGMQRAEFE